MKSRSWIAAAIVLLVAISLYAAPQADKAAPQRPTVTRDVRHDLSPPLRLIRPPAPKPSEPRVIPNQWLHLASRAGSPARSFDPLLEKLSHAPTGPMPPPLLSWEGTSDDDNQTFGGGRVVPPDTEGAVGGTGPGWYVQWNNLVFEVFDKTTGTSVLGPIAGNALWRGFGGPCETNNDGDPTVVYDQLAGRWVMSQFSIAQGTQCVAVSQTGDPTGSFYRYAFLVTPGAENDYPKMGVWPDGYYSTYRHFGGAGFSIVAAAMERDQMLLGNPAQLVLFDLDAPAGPGCTGSGMCYEGVLPSHVEGVNPPPAGAPNIFVMSDDDEYFSTTPDPNNDFYLLWKFHVDWTTPANSTFTGPVSVSAPEMNINLPGIPQPSPGEGLDDLAWFTMWRAVYKNIGGTESLWVNNTVNVGANVAGIRWAEIRNLAGTPTLYQTGTHAPSDGANRWMGSLSVDDSGNMALGYSVSSSSVYPSIRYAGRLSTDALGTLPQTETELQAGTGAQTSSFNRWGDYSAMSLDASDGCTFYYTQEYYATTGSFDFKTRIGSFRFATCGRFVPTALTVDAAGNSVLQPGETVGVAPSWRNDTGAPQAVTGALSGFTGPGDPNPSYTVTDGAASYGMIAAGATASCSTAGNCYRLALGVPTTRPVQHWDANVLETLSGGETKTWSLHVGDSFTDVVSASGYYRFVETIFHKNVTGGCGTDTYCPTATTTREQMAPFVLVSKEGAGYSPTACATPMFGDVPASSPYCKFIEELARRGVVAGCGGGNYCPTDPITREQMAVFVLLTLDPAIDPPACTAPMFGDVPASSPYCKFIEELARRGVVTGCGGGNYCPTDPVTREQMAVFLTSTFGLTLYGP